jgi:hypothetical protein
MSFPKEPKGYPLQVSLRYGGTEMGAQLEGALGGNALLSTFFLGGLLGGDPSVRSNVCFSLHELLGKRHGLGGRALFITDNEQW